MIQHARSESPATTSRYLANIRRRPTLHKDEEVRIGMRVAKGEEAARDELVLSNLGYVVRIASEYRGRSLPFEDLLSEGNVGLMLAADRYDHRRGVRFITYAAWWVRKRILRALGDQSSVVRLTDYQRRRKNQRALPAIPLDHQGPGAEKGRPIDRLADTRREDPERRLLRREQLGRLRRSLGDLSGRERAVIAQRFGLGAERGCTLKEIGASLGLTHERVRQIEVEALRKLRARMSA